MSGGNKSANAGMVEVLSKVLCHFGAARSTSVQHVLAYRDECGFTALCPCTPSRGSRTSEEARTRDSWTVILPASGGLLVRMATDVNLRLAPRYRRTATFLLTAKGNFRACAKSRGGCRWTRARGGATGRLAISPSASFRGSSWCLFNPSVLETAGVLVEVVLRAVSCRSLLG